MKLTFEKGLLGLENYKEYELKDIEGLEPFKLLRCEEEKEIGIVLMSPFEVKKDYEFEISSAVEKLIDVKDSSQLLVYTTVNVNSDPNKITTNLRAPILINKVSNKGIQVILNNEQYKIKHPISEG